MGDLMWQMMVNTENNTDLANKKIVTEWSLKGISRIQWWLPSGVIKRGGPLGNPRAKWKFSSLEINYTYGKFPIKPCFITGG